MLNKSLIGSIIDARYEIVAHIGDGGMGSVFKARQLSLDRFVAIKILHPELLGDTDSRARFEREGKVLSELTHKHIPSFYNFGIWAKPNNESSGTAATVLYPYIAMEYLEGRSLRHLLDTVGSLPWQRCLDIVSQTCDALSYAHQHRIIHRDLKPTNIMLLDQPQPDFVKIIDFGLAGLLPSHDAANQKLTMTGNLIGSAYYMSPEQCLGKKPDQRSDVYALGCILYEALSGQPPLSADNPIGLLHKHATELPQPLSETAGFNNVPAWLNAILFKALAKDPAQRYQNMKDFEQDIYLGQQGRSAEITVAADLLPISKLRKETHTRTIVAASMIMLACLSALALITISKSKTDKTPASTSKQTSSISIAKRSPNLLLNESQKMLGLGNTQAAIECFNKAIDKLEKSNSATSTSLEKLSDVSQQLALKVMRPGHNDEAIQILRQYLRVLEKHEQAPFPLKFQIRTEIGHLLAEQKSFRAAEHEYREILRLLPKDTLTHISTAAQMGLAKTMVSDGKNLAEAEKLLQGINQKGYTKLARLEAQRQLACQYSWSGQIDRAESLYKKCLSETSLNSNYDDFHLVTSLHLTEFYLHRCEYKKTIALVESLLSSANSLHVYDPRCRRLLLYAAEASLNSGHFAKAKQYYRQALNYPGEPSMLDRAYKLKCLLGLARCAGELNDIANVQWYIKKAKLYLDPKSTDYPESSLLIQTTEAFALAKNGQPDAAVDRLKKIAEAYTKIWGWDNYTDTRVDIYQQISRIRLDEGKTEEARHYIQTAIGLLKKRYGPGDDVAIARIKSRYYQLFSKELIAPGTLNQTD